METFDLIVIGGGPGGYVAAIRAAQLGMKVACVDRWQAKEGGKVVYGGTCLNVGCIPSKALLESSYLFERATHEGAEHGLELKKAAMNVTKMQARKNKVVAELTGGIGMLFKKNKVTALAGTARLAKLGPPHEVAIDGGESVAAAQVVIATGSVSRPIPPAPIDNDMIVDNIGALEFAAAPARLGVIGAGVIGLELGSVWRRLGSKVTVLEALPEFLGPVDGDIAKAALKEFTRQGLDIKLNCMVNATKVAGKKVKVSWREGDKESSTTFDKLIVAVGRMPYTEGLGAAEAGIAMDKGMIVVDDHCRTNVEGVWAIGDVVRGPMLAHKAEEEGVMVAEIIAGKHPEVDFNTIPWVIYTHPEIAWVGKNEKELKQEGVPYNKGSFPFAANGRAKSIGDTAGMVKILSHQETDRVLGAHIMGNNASDMIAELTLAMEFQGSAEDIALTCHPHPTLSEAVKEAAMATAKRAIHS